MIARWIRLMVWFVSCLALYCRAGRGDFTNTVEIQGVERLYIVHESLGYDPAVPTPVLFMFHGHYGTAQGAASSYYNWQATADSNGFIVVFPDSLSPPGKNIEIMGTIVVTNYDRTGKRWDIAHVQSNRYTSQDVEFTSGILDWLTDNYNVRTSHVFTTGHSYGAIFSYYVAVCLSNRVTAFAEHSGGLFEYDMGLYSVWWPIDVPEGSTNPPGMMLHSPADTTVAYSNSVMLYNQMTNWQHGAELITLADGLNHSWDATKNQAQWDFFMAHAPVIDDDADGMPDAWEVTYGLNTTTNDAMLDGDQDGMSNWSEYLAGTVPNDSNSVFIVERIEDLQSQQVVMQWASATDRTYRIQQADNVHSHFSNIVSGMIATPPANVYTVYCGKAAGFYRIQTEW